MARGIFLIVQLFCVGGKKMLLEVALHALAFDFAWFMPFIMDNLLWVFLLACLAHFIYGKGPILGTAFVAIYLWATFDFVNALGWVFRKGFFWAPLMGFFALTFCDSFFAGAKAYKSARPWFASAFFYCALFAINVFM